ncbi:MAG: glycosyltransferase family 39 protein [Chloroflexi bacterium]|nr:glycosyltransferase family 39 protein [Chloroflexota bacterium]
MARARLLTGSFAVWLGLIAVLATVIRLVALGTQSFWLDEGVSYITAARPLPALLAFVGREDIHPPLYYVLLHGWLAGGDSEFWLRLLSASVGIAAVVAFGLVGRLLIDARAGLAGAFILAISPLHVWYAQEARMYSLVVLLALALVGCLWQALMTTRRPGWWWAGVAVSGALLLYTSTSSVWVLAAVNLFLLGYILVTRRWQVVRGWLLSHLAMVLLFAPWLPSLRHQLAISKEIAAWIAAPTVGTAINVLTDFNSRNLPFWFRGSGEPAVVVSPLQALGPVNLLVIVVLLAAALVISLRQRRAVHWLLWCLLLAPIGLAFLISQRYVRLPLLSLVLGEGQSVFTVKNLIVAALPYYLLVAMALTRGPRWLTAAGLAVLVGLNVVSFQLEDDVRAKEDWRAMAATVQPLVRADDVVVFSPGYLESPWAYYVRHTSPLAPTRGFPRDDVGVHEPAQTRTAEQAIAGARRVWLVEAAAHAAQSPALADLLAARGAPAWQQDWSGIRARRYDLAP